MKKGLLSSLFPLLFCVTLHAQEVPKTGVWDLPFYIDADIGGFTTLDLYSTAFSHFSLGGGYRFDSYHAAGLEFRRGVTSPSYYRYTANGLGAAYRLTYGGLFTKVSTGLLLSSTDESFESYVRSRWTGGGYYYNVTLGYRFRSGFLLGASVATFANRRFNHESFEFDNAEDDPGFPDWWSSDDIPHELGSWERSGSSTESFGTITLTVGYAFPRRERKQRQSD